MADIKKSNKGGRTKTYTQSSKKFIGLPNNNSITQDMLQDDIVNEDKLSQDALPIKFNHIKAASANTSLTDNSNTNPRGLKFSDLRYRAGRTRIEVYSIELTDENMGDDLPVWKIAAGVGPKGFRDQVRFVGTGWQNLVTAKAGPCVSATQDRDYVLVTGIMDDLCIYTSVKSAHPDDIDVIVDGVDTGTNLSFEGSDVLNELNIRSLVPISDDSISTAMAGLDLHTVKIVSGDSGSSYAMYIFGFDLICSSPQEQAGSVYLGTKEESFAQQSVSDPTLSNGMGGISYRYIDEADNLRKWASSEPETASTTLTANFNFGATQMQVASTADFAVDDLVLVDDDSLGYTISEIFRVTSIDSGTLMTMTASASRTTQAGANHNFASGESVTLYGKCDTAVDHSDEQVSRSIHPRAFGAGDSGDWQYSSIAGAHSFLMDDGISSLWSNDGIIVTPNNQLSTQEVMTVDDGTSNRGVYIFNGTGLDIVINKDNQTSDADFYIDGVKVYDYTSGATAEYKTIKLCSGLPMGTHILNIHQMSSTAVQNTPHIAKFIEYIPSDPSAISSVDTGNLIARRDFTADYVFNSGTELDDLSKGVNYYGPTRGWKLTDSSTAWGLAGATVYTYWDRLEGKYDTTDAIAETWFYGTGFELVMNCNSNQGTPELEIDGSTNFSSFNVHESEQRFTAATGRFDLYNASSIGAYKLGVTGLTLGWHKLKITQDNTHNGLSSDYLIHIAALGVIGGSATLTSPVGALQQICTANAGESLDIRRVKPLESEENVVNFAQARGINSYFTTTSTSLIPLPDLTVNIKTSGNPLKIDAKMIGSNNGANQISWAVIFIDGIEVGVASAIKQGDTGNQYIGFSLNEIHNIAAGLHTVTIYLKVASGTYTNYAARVSLSAQELPGVKNENS